MPLRKAAVAVAVAGLWGCTPAIGDKCSLSTDCSIRADRQCDSAMPGGYCTIRNCGSNSCPDESTCIAFQSSIPGCSYDDRVIARTARSQCMYLCEKDSDCRDGYVCRDVKQAPWSAKVLDDDQTGRVCITPERAAGVAVPDVPADGPIAPVCLRSGVDASLPPSAVIDAGLPNVDAGGDGGDGGPFTDGSAGDAGDAGLGGGGN